MHIFYLNFTFFYESSFIKARGSLLFKLEFEIFTAFAQKYSVESLTFIMSGNKRTKANTSVDFPSLEHFEQLNQAQGRILRWNELEQGGENIYFVRRYFKNTKSKFESEDSIILDLEKKNSLPCKVYCGGVVAKDVCAKWKMIIKGQKMFLRPNGTAQSQAGNTYYVANIVIQ